MQGLQELLVDSLRDIYDAEKQLVRALPKSRESVIEQRTEECVQRASGSDQEPGSARGAMLRSARREGEEQAL